MIDLKLHELKSKLSFTLLLLQGLFHPARKVRDVYWKIYNSLYIGGQDALVAGYPRILNDPKNQYVRYELDYIL
jgi:splicing factor 3B subunit 1